MTANSHQLSSSFDQGLNFTITLKWFGKLWKKIFLPGSSILLQKFLPVIIRCDNSQVLNMHRKVSFKLNIKNLERLQSTCTCTCRNSRRTLIRLIPVVYMVKHIKYCTIPQWIYKLVTGLFSDSILKNFLYGVSFKQNFSAISNSVDGEISHGSVYKWTMRKLSNIFWASKFAHSDCSCNESNAYNNTLPADSNMDVPFTICPWLALPLITIQSYLESGKTASGHIHRKHASI